MDWELLRTLSETAAVPGKEDAMRTIMKDVLAPLVDDLSVDVMGNVIGHKRGAGKRGVMIAAHMDEIGFYVRAIEEKGFLRLQPVGGFDPRQLFAQRVRVTTRQGEVLPGVLTYATKPTHLLSDEERKQAPKLEQFFVDLGLPVETVRAKVELGDMVTMVRTCIDCGDMVVGKCLDNRVGVFVMIEALRQLQAAEVDIYAVATVQEEVGLRGAGTSAFALDPEIAIALDTTLACDHPGMTDTETITRLGDGVAIKIMDSSLICHPKLVDHMRQVAVTHGIKHQLEILPRGGTDAGAMQRTGGGRVSMTLSIPTRYIHTVNEMVSRQDVEAAAALLARYLEEAHDGAYAF
jgi:tetrahedral aminopeptidase